MGQAVAARRICSIVESLASLVHPDGTWILRLDGGGQHVVGHRFMQRNAPEVGGFVWLDTNGMPQYIAPGKS